MAAAGVTLMLTAVAGCGHQGGTLRLAGNLPAGRVVVEGVARVHPGVPHSLGSMTICVDKPGPATITGVKPLLPIGRVVVQAYSVRPNPFVHGGVSVGDETGRLTKFGFGRGQHVVRSVCGSRPGASYELGIQLIKTTERDVGAAGWIVSYEVDGREGTLKVPVAVELCSERSADAARCRKLDHALRRQL